MATRYLNADSGSDLNDGLTPQTAWATPGQVVTYVNALSTATDVVVEIADGAYTGGLYFIPAGAGVNVTVNCETGCTFDVTGGGNGVGLGTASCTLTANLNGAIFNGSNISSANGYSMAGGVGHVHDGIFDGFDDGFSCHFSSVGWTYDCTFRNCTKAAYAHVNDSIAHHLRCTFEGRSGASSGIGLSSSTQWIDFEDCTFTPATAGQSIAPSGTLFTRCVIGNTTNWVNFGNFTTGAANFTDCFINFTMEGFGTTTWTRCYGLLNATNGAVRLRGTASTPMTMDGCVWKSTSKPFVYGNFDGGAAWLGGTVTIKNTIFTGFSTVIGFNSTTQRDHMNANWVVDHCCFFSNSTNFQSGLTLGTNLITSNPLLGAANTTVQNDFCTEDSSPCRLAGTPAGFNIGLPARSFSESTSGGVALSGSGSGDTYTESAGGGCRLGGASKVSKPTVRIISPSPTGKGIRCLTRSGYSVVTWRRVRSFSGVEAYISAITACFERS